jgi:DNA-binding NtrC family response regulator
VEARNLISEIRAVDQGAKTIVSSGYSEKPAMSSHASSGFCGAFVKPYDMKLLTGIANRESRAHIPGEKLPETAAGDTQGGDNADGSSIRTRPQ